LDSLDIQAELSKPDVDFIYIDIDPKILPKLNRGQSHREHYLDLSGFESRVNTLLLSDLSDSRVLNEILRMFSFIYYSNPTTENMMSTFDILCTSCHIHFPEENFNRSEKKIQHILFSAPSALPAFLSTAFPRLKRR
jgi:hypothetical protein